MDYSKFLFRASAIGLLMTEPKTKAAKEAGELSETTKTYLKQVHRELRYNRKKEFSNKYIEKGLKAEEDAITLYCRIKKRFFKKNDIRLNNEFVTGEPDLFTGASIYDAETTIDTKASWDVFTFPYPDDELKSIYEWQGHTYMWLTGAKKHTVAYCLIDTPENIIESEKRQLFYKMNAGVEENPEYIQACEEVDKSLRFGDIPMSERLMEFEVPRDKVAIHAITQKVIRAREYLTHLDTLYYPTIQTDHKLLKTA